MKKILNLKQMIMLEFKSAKLFSLKDMLLIGMKTFLLGKKYVITDLNCAKFL